jgi:hypothetical protein
MLIEVVANGGSVGFSIRWRGRGGGLLGARWRRGRGERIVWAPSMASGW